jgi:hypothetical protein
LKWVSTTDIARELGLDDGAVKDIVYRAANKGWLEIDGEEGSRFRLSKDLAERLDELGLPLA